MLASKSYKGIDTVTTYDARTGSEVSTYDLPEKHNFIENGIVRNDEAVVLVSSPECERGELALFGLKDRSIIVPLYRPANCSKPKDGEVPQDPKVFHGPDSTRLLITQDGDPDLRIFDVATRRMTSTFRWPDVAKPEVLGVSGDMRLVASKEGDGVVIRNLESGKPVKELRSFAAYSDAMAASPDGSQILVQRSAPEHSKAPVDVSLWRLDDPKPVTLKLRAEGNYRIHDFAPAAMIALSGNDNGDLAILPLDGKGAPRKLTLPGLKSVTTARLSPDGKLAIVRGIFSKSGAKDDGEEFSALIDIADGKTRQKFETTEEAFVTGFAFSPDGSQFALGLRNGGAEIWDTARRRRSSRCRRPRWTPTPAPSPFRRTAAA